MLAHASTYLVNGDTPTARQIFEKVIAGRAWPAFGFIAAEADLNEAFRTRTCEV